MNKIKIILTLALSFLVCFSVDAQTGKKTAKKKKAKTQTENKKASNNTDLQQTATPKYKQFSDPEMVKYISGGFTKDRKLFLMTSAEYDSLNNEQKKAVLNKVAQEFPEHDITVYKENQRRELWIASNQHLCLIDQWDNDSLHIENYLPLELNRTGKTKVFYYIGGSFNGSRGQHSGIFDTRCGTYLFENRWDASASFSLGYARADGSTQFTGSTGLDSRVYFPIKKNNLSPYGGAGISWSFSPSSYFEIKLLAGACWFVGNGSLDFGAQYGTKSGLSFTIGYTFRPNIKL